MKQKRWGRGEEGRRQLENFRPPPHYRFLFRSRFSFRVAELLYVPISGLLQDGKGGGGEGVAGTHGKLAFSGCQFSHPWVSIMSQINAPAAN